MLLLGNIDNYYMEVNIKNNKTIQNELKIQLGEFTIFAGENNSGKTQIVKEIKNQLEKNDVNVIEILAEKVILENEITVGAKDNFRKTLDGLINLTFSKKAFIIKNGIDDIETELPKLFNEYKVNDITLNVKRGTPTDDEYKKVIKDALIKKALDSITIKDELNSNPEIKLEDAGQGTERLVIVSLLRYLASKDLKNKEQKPYLIIEEPEIFLHPKLKKTFNKALEDISEQINVIITTHDPYFITLNNNKKIYRIYRETENTEIKEIEPTNILDYRSHAEINYLIFDFPTIEYAIQLYEKFIKSDEEKKSKTIEYDKKEKKLVDIRNEIAHADNSPREEQLKEFIDGIIKNKN